MLEENAVCEPGRREFKDASFTTELGNRGAQSVVNATTTTIRIALCSKCKFVEHGACTGKTTSCTSRRWDGLEDAVVANFDDVSSFTDNFLREGTFNDELTNVVESNTCLILRVCHCHDVPSLTFSHLALVFLL